MTNTPNLDLPYLAAAQAQKHVTVNEALDHLDGLVQLSVISSTLSSPPAGPAEGDRYIVAASATGAWAGWEDSVAQFSGGAWLRRIPQAGWIVWDQDASGIATFDNGAWSQLSTGSSGGGGAVTYNPFQKRVEIPLTSDFPANRDSTGAVGSISDDAVNGLTLTSTSGTPAARTIYTKDLPADWSVIEFEMTSSQSSVSWGSNGFVLMAASGRFVTVGVGSTSGSIPTVRILEWATDGSYITSIQNSLEIEGWSAYFRLIRRNSKIIVYHSYEGAAWVYTGTINETADLGGSALYIGPSANNSTTVQVIYYADDDILPQFAGFVGAGGGSAPVAADTTLSSPQRSAPGLTEGSYGCIQRMHDLGNPVRRGNIVQPYCYTVQNNFQF